MSERVKVAVRLSAEVERFYAIGRVTGERVIPTNPGVFPITVEGGKTYYLKLKSQPPARIEFEHGLLDYLARRGVPVAPPVKTRAGETVFRTRLGGPFALYPELRGKRMTSWKPEHLRIYATFLARLHGVMRGFPGGRSAAGDSDLIKTALGAADALLSPAQTPLRELERGLFRAARMEIIRTFTPAMRRRTARQIIHRDYHPWNVKISGGQVSGILDFEMAVRDIRIFDLCYLAGSILSDDFRNARRWPERFEIIRGAYEEVSPLNGAEKKCIRAVFLAIGILYTQFLLRQHSVKNALHNQSVLRWLHDEWKLF